MSNDAPSPKVYTHLIRLQEQDDRDDVGTLYRVKTTMPAKEFVAQWDATIDLVKQKAQWHIGEVFTPMTDDHGCDFELVEDLVKIYY